MLATIGRFMRGADRVIFTLSREGVGRVRVLVQPVLGAEPEGLDDEAKQLRAALAQPLIISTTDDKLDTAVPDLIARAATARDDLAARFEAYADGLKHEAEAKKPATGKGPTKGPAKAAPAAATAGSAAPAQPPPAASTTPAPPAAESAAAEPVVQLFEGL